jgi:hypothetical protein
MDDIPINPARSLEPMERVVARLVLEQLGPRIDAVHARVDAAQTTFREELKAHEAAQLAARQATDAQLSAIVEKIDAVVIAVAALTPTVTLMEQERVEAEREKKWLAKHEAQQARAAQLAPVPPPASITGVQPSPLIDAERMTALDRLSDWVKTKWTATHFLILVAVMVGGAPLAMQVADRLLDSWLGPQTMEAVTPEGEPLQTERTPRLFPAQHLEDEPAQVLEELTGDTGGDGTAQGDTHGVRAR